MLNFLIFEDETNKNIVAVLQKMHLKFLRLFLLSNYKFETFFQKQIPELYLPIQMMNS